MDKICIEDLEIYAQHGVYPEENKLGQKFVVCAQLYVDTRKAAQQDDITQSVNYGEVCHFIKQWMEQYTVRLLETVADRLAQQILLKFPLIQQIRLEVKKPNAPIPIPFGSVSVVAERQWHQVYVGVGSNMGDREANIQNALQMLETYEDCQIVRVSKWLYTEPYGYTDQPEFINGCLLVKTLQSPELFLETLHTIEQYLGRERNMHWGPRTIDLDILLYDEAIIDREYLTVPHIDMQNRMFVLKPLEEIAGFVRHPILQQTIHQLRQQLEQKLQTE